LKPKKLKQDQIDMVKRSNKRHTLFTFDTSHPFYYIIDYVFRDPKKNMLVYFDEENGTLVWMEQLSEETNIDTPKVLEWIEGYHKRKKKNEKEVEKKKAERKKPGPKVGTKPRVKKAKATPKKSVSTRPKFDSTVAKKAKAKNKE
jgi:hypothetical protein